MGVLPVAPGDDPARRHARHPARRWRASSSRTWRSSLRSSGCSVSCHGASPRARPLRGLAHRVVPVARSCSRCSIRRRSSSPRRSGPSCSSPTDTTAPPRRWASSRLWRARTASSLALALACAVGMQRAPAACGSRRLPCAALARLDDVQPRAYRATRSAFFHAKHAWSELTLVGLLDPQSDRGDRPSCCSPAAVVALLIAARDRIPRSWSVLTVLYLVPSLALGIIGLGRYAGECFPPFAAGGELLARSRRPVARSRCSRSSSARKCCSRTG